MCKKALRGWSQRRVIVHRYRAFHLLQHEIFVADKWFKRLSSHHVGVDTLGDMALQEVVRAKTYIFRMLRPNVIFGYLVIVMLFGCTIDSTRSKAVVLQLWHPPFDMLLIVAQSFVFEFPGKSRSYASG